MHFPIRGMGSPRRNGGVQRSSKLKCGQPDIGWKGVAFEGVIMIYEFNEFFDLDLTMLCDYLGSAVTCLRCGAVLLFCLDLSN